eukprot:1816827-Amphidinium_carterae.1
MKGGRHCSHSRHASSLPPCKHNRPRSARSTPQLRAEQSQRCIHTLAHGALAVLKSLVALPEIRPPHHSFEFRLQLRSRLLVA